MFWRAMTRDEFKARTKAFAPRVIKPRCAGKIPSRTALVAERLSVSRWRRKPHGFRYSFSEVASMLVDAPPRGSGAKAPGHHLLREGGEILAITVASIKTARRGK
jgi:integrase